MPSKRRNGKDLARKILKNDKLQGILVIKNDKLQGASGERKGWLPKTPGLMACVPEENVQRMKGSTLNKKVMLGLPLVQRVKRATRENHCLKRQPNAIW